MSKAKRRTWWKRILPPIKFRTKRIVKRDKSYICKNGQPIQVYIKDAIQDPDMFYHAYDQATSIHPDARPWIEGRFVLFK